jgi:hypothetical protein
LSSRLLLLLAAVWPALLAGGPAGATDWDWGGSLDNATKVDYVSGASSVDLEQKDKLALWIDFQLSPSVTLAAAGSYLIGYDTASEPPFMPYLFDADYLKAEWTLRPSWRATAGRFPVSDFTGLLLDHTLDGVQMRWDLPFMSLTANLGSSALLLKPTSRIILSGSDRADLLDTAVHLAAPRLVQAVSAVFPQLFAGQDLTVALLAQEDLRPAARLIPEGYEDPSYTGRAGGRLHSVYLGTGLSGPIVSSLYYESFLYFETGSTLSYIEDSASGTGSSWQNKPIVAFLGGFGVRYYMEKFLGSRLGLRGLFASGDADNQTFLEGNTVGSSTLFAPISRKDTGLAFNPQLGNLLLVEASYSLKPAEILQAILKIQTFLRPSAGAISETGLDSASAARYLGTQIEGSANFRPLSDLGLALTLGACFPAAAAFLEEQPRLGGRFELSLSF